MDRADVKTEWEAPKENPLEGMTQEQIRKLLEYRSEVLMDVNQAYKDFIETIYKHPFHVIYRQHAFLNIDQGLHWIKTAVDNLWELPKTLDDCIEKVIADEAQIPLQEIV